MLRLVGGAGGRRADHDISGAALPNSVWPNGIAKWQCGGALALNCTHSLNPGARNLFIIQNMPNGPDYAPPGQSAFKWRGASSMAPSKPGDNLKRQFKSGK